MPDIGRVQLSNLIADLNGWVVNETRRIDRTDVIVALPKLNIGLVKEVTAIQECLKTTMLLVSLL